MTSLAFPPGSTALGVAIPAKYHPEIDLIRRKYDPSVGILIPHITLIYPPFVPLAEWPKMKPEVSSCLLEFESFSISMRTFGEFTQPGQVLWLAPEDGGVLTRIQAELERRFPHHISPSTLPYIPHCSVGFFNNLESMQKARGEIGPAVKPIHFIVDEIRLMVLRDDGSWDLEEELPLRKA